MSEAVSGEPWSFSSPNGLALCRQILQKQLPYCPHDYQLEGIAKILDGHNLVAIIRTGGGKSAYVYMALLVIQAIQEDHNLCAAHKSFPLDAGVLLVLPTISLQQDQVSVSQIEHFSSTGSLDFGSVRGKRLLLVSVRGRFLSLGA